MKREQTYAQLQEAAAWALNRLIVDDYLPVEQQAVAQVMACREAAHAALAERLQLLGWNPRWSVSRAKSLGNNGAGGPLFLLGDVVYGLPRQLPEHRVSPLDALTTASTDPGREAWRHAARGRMQGTHALATAPDRPWMDDRGAAWFVIADCATSLEALVVLDERLAEVGLLSGHGPGIALPLPNSEARMRLAHCDHVAACNATSDRPDLAVAHRAETEQAVRIVRQPSDLIDAQRRLAVLVRPLRRAWEGSALERVPHINLPTARNVLFGQLDLCDRLDALCRAHTPAGGLAAYFAGRREELRSLLPGADRLTEFRPVEGRRLVVWQQEEITLGVRKLSESGPVLDPHQVQALCFATHAAIAEFARTLRNEIRARGSNITSTRQDDETQLRADVRGTPLDRSLAALARRNHQRCSFPRGNRTMERAALRATLWRTPSADAQTTSPFVHQRRDSRLQQSSVTRPHHATASP